VFRSKTLQLTLLAVASLAVYLFAFVRPYGLLEWWTRPGLTIAKIAHNDPRSGAAYVVSFLLLFLFCWLAARLVLGEHRASLWAIVIFSALAFNAVMLFQYPVDAVDVYENVIRGRMQGLYGANPFYQTPSQFPQDPFYQYTIWHDNTSAYGPWWELLAAGAARISGDGILANTFSSKGICILGYAAAALFIGLALKKQVPERTMFGVTLFAWNPMVIYSTAGNGHNDAVMTFFMVLGFYLLARGNLTLAAMAETGGALVKFIPALLVPIIFVAALKKASGWKARFRYVVLTSLACALMIAVSYAPYWHGGDILGSDWRSKMFTTSLATVVQIALAQRVGSASASLIVSRLALLLLGAWVAQRLWNVWRRNQGTRVALIGRQAYQHYVHAGLMILLFYLLVSVLWFQPWYVVWPMALAALLPDGALLRTTVVLTLAATFKMVAYDYVIGMRPGYVPPANIREWQATAMTWAVPWVTFLYQYLGAKRERRKRARIERTPPIQEETRPAAVSLGSSPTPR
jgi:alpha-1,6-mannosyltransferase